MDERLVEAEEEFCSIQTWGTDPEWRNGSAAVSEAVGCWFKSSLGNHSGVAQWQGARL